MSVNEILTIARATERILIVLICGASLGFGWNLFRVGILNDQKAEMSWNNWKIAFRQVGPGIFFALFAVVGLVFALKSPLTVGDLPSSAQSAKGATTETSEHINYIGDAADNAKREISAINTVAVLWTAYEPQVPAAHQASAREAFSILRARKEMLLGAEYPDQYPAYQAVMEKLRKNPGAIRNLDQKEKANYEVVQPIADANFVRDSAPR